MRKITWALEDHLCRKCGGRMLRSVSGVGPTGGGNPLYQCADCGTGGACIGTEHFCWCGFALRGHPQGEGSYRCLPFSILKEKPEYLSAFQNCGCDPGGNSQVGIVLISDIRRIDTAAQQVARNEE